MREFAVTSIMIVLLTGCATTPTTQIEAFGDSAKALTDKVGAVIDEYNEAVLTRRFTDYAATYSGRHASLLTSTLLEEIHQPIDNNAKQGMALYRANSAIGAYAQSLSALATAGSQADIDLASAKLYGAMVGINTQYNATNPSGTDLFSTTDFAAATKLIAAIGSSIIEKQRNDAIKGIVISADAKIGTLCDLIDRQLDESGVYEGIRASRQYVLTEEVKDYQSRAQQDTTLEWRRTEIKRLHSLQQGVITSRLLVQNAQKAIRAVKEAHAVLANELKNDKFTSASIAQAIGHLKDLENRYNSYETLLLECKKIEKDKNGSLFCNDEKK